MKKLLFIFLALPVILLSALELSFRFKGFRTFDFGSRDWIHHTGEPANTLEGFHKAVKAGYTGIECDVHYLEKEDRFILSHDLPNKNNSVYLEDIFSAMKGNNVKLWIDYKNADVDTIEKVVKKLKALEKEFQVENRYFVESPNKAHQVLLSREAINTVLWVELHQLSRMFYFRDLTNRLSIVLGDFISISLPIEKYSENVQSAYSNSHKLIFTVNNNAQLEMLKKDETVKVVLKDLPR